MKLSKGEFDMARNKMRLFLKARPRMDFILDTSLPWETVSQSLEVEWERIKTLRDHVGLERNVTRKRKRQWKEQLQLYDICLPNRQKYRALRRIWSEELGFAKALQLLDVRLSENEIQLAGKLDNKGWKPKGFYRFVDKQIERASQEAAMAPQNHKLRFGEDGRLVPSVDFDYESLDASSSGVEVKIVADQKPSSDLEDGKVIKSWRRHFSIQKPRLPDQFAKMSRGLRKDWLSVASQRIESIWPAKLERNF